MTRKPGEGVAEPGETRLGVDELLSRAVERGLIDDGLAAALRALAADRPPAADPGPALAEDARRRRQNRRIEGERLRQGQEEHLRVERERRAAEERAQRDRRSRERDAEIGAIAALRGDGAATRTEGDGGWLAIVGDGAPGGEEMAFRREVLPLIYENVGWFVGSLLVLTGSIFGLREAWISFDAAGRWASVAGALFAYHALFVMVSAVLARRSALAGQFLAGIGACLAPLAYVAVANLSALRLAPGLAAAAMLTGAGLVTLGGVGRRFGAGRALAPALLWPALTLLVYPHLPSASAARFGLPILALAGPWLATHQKGTRASVGAFILALYAALASEIFALSSNAVGESVTAALGFRTDGPAFGAWLGAYVTALGLTLFGVRAMSPSSDTKRRALATVVWLGFALTVGAGALSALAALQVGGVPPDRSALLSALAATTAACVLARLLGDRWRQATYLLLILGALASAVAGRLGAPDQPLAWAAAALLPAALALGGARLGPLPRFATEMAAAEAAIIIAVLWACEPARGGVYPITLIAGLALAAGAHRQAARGQGWHYFGAASAAIAIGLGIAPSRDGAVAAYAYVALATVYAIWALAARRMRGDRDPAKLSPLDDASLCLYAIGAIASLSRLSFAPAFSWRPVEAAALPLVVSSAGLLLRALLDRSALPSMLGALGLSIAAVATTGPRSSGAQALVLALLALAAAALSALFTPRVRATALGRTCFGARELPWGWSGRGAVAQGFGLAAFPLGLLSTLAALGWFGQRAIDRPLAIAADVALALTCAVLFVTRAAAIVGLRGRAALLWALAAAAALAAISNRIDRPLPPAVVGRNLTLIGAALWILARGAARVGDWLEEKLEADAGEGARYHLVPHAGVAALGLLLLVDAWLLAPLPLFRGLNVVPPLMLLGPALLGLLLGRSARAPSAFWIAAPLLAAGAALIGAQHALLGPVLARLGARGLWIPAGGASSLPGVYRDALVGLAGAAAIFGGAASLVDRRPRIGARLGRLLWIESDPKRDAWLADAASATAAAIVLLICAWGFWITSIGATLLALASGAALGTRPRGRARLLPPLATLALTIHAFAQLSPSVGTWPGVALAALAVSTALVTHRTLADTTAPEQHLARAHAVVAGLTALAIVYGLAEGATTTALPGGWTAIASGFGRLGTWGGSPAPALALGIGSVACVVAATSWNALVRRAETLLSIVSGAVLATMALGTFAVWRAGTAGAERLVLIAASATAVGIALHAASARLGERFDDLVHGARQTRDGLMVMAGALLAATVALVRVTSSPLTPPAALLTLAALFGLSLAALGGERRPRHVYFLGVTLVGGYGFLRVTGIVRLQPADDALALLALDFGLVGLTVLARRSGLDAIATATRRFAAALPLVIGLLLPWQATPENALFSLGAGAFFGLLGWVERNRVLGAFGGVAANLALLVLSLSRGFGGFDVYLAPLGLSTLIVVHIFEGSMTADARGALRFCGTGLTYAPAAIALVLQVGNAESDFYPLGFAAACLAGIAAGMWFHIRAYLVLGLTFLLLDLGTLLVRASLRSQRLGFFVLSLTGLLILSAMVAYTMRRDRVRSGLWRLRRALGTWR